jgi:pimeloyl-ACP methyl ester carboxylesterase
MTESIRADFPDWSFPGADLILDGAAALFGGIMGHWGFRNTHPYFSSDVMVEAEAGVAFDAREVLSSISVPLLLIAGDEDADFPQPLVDKTARLIPDCELKLYQGKNHMQTFFDVQTGRDILAFTRQTATKPYRDT